MPHLQFELTTGPAADERRRFTDWVTERFASVMETGTGHVAVTVRDVPAGGLSLGRAPIDEPAAVLNADIRAGRSAAQRRTFATAVIERLATQFDIPAEHCYVVYTEHPGEDFHLAEGTLESWTDAEADEGAL